jgi:hypothetical protein
MSTKTTVILPIHKIENEQDNAYLNDALTSVEKQKVTPEELLVVIPKGAKDIKKMVENLEFEAMKDKVRFVENEGETDFCSQVNFGVENVNTEYFSVLEFDDAYSIIWFENVVKYMESYPTVDMYLPIVVDMNTENRFLHFTNEVLWAKEFSDKQGYLDNDSLLNYPKFQFSGSVIKTETFNTTGKLKPSIKLQFVYEFMLRMTYYDKKIMTIPKLGYKKTNMRPNSLFWSYENGEDKIDLIEAKFWFNTARKESYFKTDRQIKYNVEEENV